jgi:Protein of unknown function with HXXEE motif
MRLDTFSALLIWASVIVFAVHNIEETFGIEEWVAEKLRPSIAARYRKKPFIVASTLLWVAYTVVATVAVLFTSPALFQVFCVAFAALVANGFVHVLALPFFGKIPPGFWSAAILVLPLGALLTWHAITTGTLTPRQALAAFVIGAVLQMPLAGGAIFISASLLGLKERIFQK